MREPLKFYCFVEIMSQSNIARKGKTLELDCRLLLAVSMEPLNISHNLHCQYNKSLGETTQPKTSAEEAYSALSWVYRSIIPSLCDSYCGRLAAEIGNTCKEERISNG